MPYLPSLLNPETVRRLMAAQARRPAPTGRSTVGGDPHILSLKPGQRVELPGAEVTVDQSGTPNVRLKPGYENGSDAARAGPVLAPSGPKGAMLNQDIEWLRRFGSERPILSRRIFRELVPKGGLWDFKRSDPSHEAFGNFHFGATGRTLFPEWMLRQEAGRRQGVDNEPRADWGRPGIPLLPFTGSKSFGDDPVDQFWITEGARYERARN